VKDDAVDEASQPHAEPVPAVTTFITHSFSRALKHRPYPSASPAPRAGWKSLDNGCRAQYLTL
jgi:hypothetical protein